MQHIETQFPDYALDVFFILQLDSYWNVTIIILQCFDYGRIPVL